MFASSEIFQNIFFFSDLIAGLHPHDQFIFIFVATEIVLHKNTACNHYNKILSTSKESQDCFAHVRTVQIGKDEYEKQLTILRDNFKSIMSFTKSQNVFHVYYDGVGNGVKAIYSNGRWEIYPLNSNSKYQMNVSRKYGFLHMFGM